MPDLGERSRPRLAVGCRWAETAENEVLVFPEGVLRLQGTAIAILKRCDGTRTFQEIVRELQTLYGASDPNKIHEDAVVFLRKLHHKRLVEFDD